MSGHKLFIQTCLWPFNHTSCRRASCITEKDRKLGTSKAKVCDFHL